MNELLDKYFEIEKKMESDGLVDKTQRRFLSEEVLLYEKETLSKSEKQAIKLFDKFFEHISSQYNLSIDKYYMDLKKEEVDTCLELIKGLIEQISSKCKWKLERIEKIKLEFKNEYIYINMFDLSFGNLTEVSMNSMIRQKFGSWGLFEENKKLIIAGVFDKKKFEHLIKRKNTKRERNV